MSATETKPNTDSLNETEERLLDCALTVFAAQGYAGASVREIIQAAGVTRPVLYYYCKNKEHLFKRVVQWTHDDAYRELDQQLAAASGLTDKLRVILRGTFAFCAKDRRVPQLMFQTTFGPAVTELADYLQAIAQRRFEIVARVIQEGIDSGELHGGSRESLALVFCSLMDYHANALSRTPSPEDLLTPALADELVDTFLHGVATERKAQ